MHDLCGRPEGYEELIVQRHAHLVAPQDTLINLGDVFFYRPEALREALRRIPGTHVLVLGNHDRRSARWYRDAGFAYVCDGLVLGDALLTHRPAWPLPAGIRHAVHGHHHNMGDRVGESPWLDPKVHHLVALEFTDYRPVPLRRIVDRARTEAGWDPRRPL
jgi:calcineurin-like phosphoesterase family protein